LLEQYNIDTEIFFQKLGSEAYKEKAYYDFSLIQQLKVNGFPTVFLQLDDAKLYMISRGFSTLEAVEQRMNKILAENNIQ